MPVSKSLALGVFIRPEAHFLPSTFAFISRLVDELVIVVADRSAHTTPQRLPQGFRLIELEWRDDFAFARNQLIESVQSDWLLVVEHNELVPPETLAKIRTLTEQAGAAQDIHCLRIEVVDGAENVVETAYEPRLWHRDVTPHFRGRIFEQIQANDGQTYVFHDDIRFRQEFEARSEAEEIRIQERNRRLLELQYEETPEDCHTRFCIGLTLMVEGELESSLAMLSDVIRDVGDCDCARSAQVFSIECLRKLGRAREAVEQGLEWAKLSPEYGELWFSIGRAALESDQRIRAQAAFGRAQSIMMVATPGLYRDPTIADYKAMLGQAQAYASLRDVEAAEDILGKVRSNLPDSRQEEVDSDFIEIWLQLNKPKKAFELVEYWIERSPIWSSTSLLKIVEYCFTAQGPAQAYLMYQGAIVAHEILLTYLHVVTVGAALCEMVDDHQSYFHHLQLCVDLGSQQRLHYRELAKLYVERGDLERAKTIAELELKLSENGEG